MTNSLILIYTSILLTASCNTSKNTNTMTDLTDVEIIQLYQKHSGEKIDDPSGFCINKATSLKGVYSLGWFAHDRGCMGNEILVGKTIGERSSMTQIGLEANEWKDVKKQQELSLKWTQEVILAWEIPLEDSNEDFELDSTPAFEAPTCIKHRTGWKVTIWVKEPSGMQPQADYYQLEVLFNADGTILSQNKINSFYVEY